MTRPATLAAATATTAADPPLPTSGPFRPEAPGRDAGRRPVQPAGVRSWTVPTPVIRIADGDDGPAIAALRRVWTAEQHGDVADEDYEARFLEWYAHESGHRVSWLAELSAEGCIRSHSKAR